MYMIKLQFKSEKEKRYISNKSICNFQIFHGTFNFH